MATKNRTLGVVLAEIERKTDRILRHDAAASLARAERVVLMREAVGLGASQAEVARRAHINRVNVHKALSEK